MTYLPTITAAPWTDRALCGGEDPAMWELTGGEHTGTGTLTAANQRAIALCASCPVAQQCLAEAVEQGAHGVIRAGIPMWRPVQWFHCERCGRRGVRLIGSNRGPGKQRYCAGCSRRAPSGYLPVRACVDCGETFQPTAVNRRAKCPTCVRARRLAAVAR